MSLMLKNTQELHAALNSQQKCEIVWIAEKNYMPGTIIEIRSKRLRTLVEWRHAKIHIENADILYRWKMSPTATEIWYNSTRALIRAKLQYGIRRGEECRIHITAIPPVWAGIDELLTIWTKDPVNSFASKSEDSIAYVKEENSECRIPVRSAHVNRLEIKSHPMGSKNKKVKVCIIPEDRFGNPSIFENEINTVLEWEEKEIQIKLKGPLTVYLDSSLVIQRPLCRLDMKQLTVNENICNGLKSGNEILISGNPVWPDNNEKIAAFGEFHWHTEMSGDGDGKIEDALLRARDYMNLNFVAPSDHNPGDEYWDKTVKALNEFNNEDDFVTFFGWENSSDQGHENYYFIDWNHPVRCGGEAGITGGKPFTLIDKLSLYEDFIAIPHHTNSVAETRNPDDDTPVWYPYSWSNPVNYIPLTEIMQLRGNQERNEYTEAWRGWHQNYGASIQDALASGYKIGFTGGTDNHCAWPGRAYASHEGGVYHNPKSEIMTGIWTEKLDRKNVFEALKNRNTWAVWDTRAIVLFKINDILMGGTLHAHEDEKIFAEIKVSAEDSIQALQIVSDKNVIWETSVSELDCNIKVELDSLKKNSYYYLRGLLRNGGIFYASPVFIAQ